MKTHARFLNYIFLKKAPNLSILKILKYFKGAGKAIITDITFSCYGQVTCVIFPLDSAADD